MGDDLSLLDGVGQAELIRRGDATPVELLDAAIERIERMNPTLNAVVADMFDKARAAALSPDLPDGPLRGVPMLLKDHLTGTAGDPMYEGMRFLRDLDWHESRDSYVAQKLRGAGLLLTGKTNLPELAIITTTESVAYGACLNPWDTGRSVGGSSGGSGAAVASGMVPIAHGTDAGGSIRIPAAFCGVVGLKPSRGRVSQGPDFSDMWGNGSWHINALTRSVRDAALMLDITSGYCAGDPFTAPAVERPLREEVGRPPGRLRIGLLDRAPQANPALHPECHAGVTAAAKLLEELGHDVELAFPDAIDHMMEGAIEAFLGMAGSGIQWNLDRWSRVTGRPIGEDDVEPYTWAFAELGRQSTGPQFLQGLAQVQESARRLSSWWDSGFDLLLSPTTGTPAYEIGFLASPPDNPLAPLYKASSVLPFTGMYNITGQPAISLPLHVSADGLPVGVQLGAAYGREDVLVRIAAQIEEAAPWADRIPPHHASRS